MRKKIFIATVALTLAFVSLVAFAKDYVRVCVNGVEISVKGFLEDSTTYIPLRAVTEALGAEVSWDGSTKTASVVLNEDSMITKIVESVSPSVVAVVGNYKPNYMSEAETTYNGTTAHGTGVVIKSNGTILTNAHVVEGLENITVVFLDGSSYPAKIQNIDKKADLAVIKINKLGLAPIKFGNPDSVVSGKTVIAIGTPLSLSMRNTVTKGIVSGVDVSIPDTFYPLIQTDAAINAGNSGGPLINMDGELIGINSSKYAGIGIEGMSFSITLDTINYVLDQFSKNGKVLRPDISVTFENSWEANIGLPTSKGITVKYSGSPVLKAGDVVTAVNGIELHSILDYNRIIRDTFNGKTMTVTYTRNGVSSTVTLEPELSE